MGLRALGFLRGLLVVWHGNLMVTMLFSVAVRYRQAGFILTQA